MDALPHRLPHRVGNVRIVESSCCEVELVIPEQVGVDHRGAAVAWLSMERKEDARVHASVSPFANASRQELVALIMGYVNSAPREAPLASPRQITEECGCSTGSPVG